MANHVLALPEGTRPYPWIPSGEHELRSLLSKPVNVSYRVGDSIEGRLPCDGYIQQTFFPATFQMENDLRP